MPLTTEQKKNRWNRLEAMAYLAHSTAYPESYGEPRLNPAWGADWHRKVEKRINALKRRILEAEGDKATRFTISWCPSTLSTYGVDLLLQQGGAALEKALGWDDDTLGYKTMKEVESWEPLPDLSTDSEGSCGFVYCSQHDRPEVLRRLKVLEPDATPSVSDGFDASNYVSYTAPESWGTEAGWALNKKGVIPKLNLPTQERDKSKHEMIEEIAKALTHKPKGEVVKYYRKLLSTSGVGYML